MPQNMSIGDQEVGPQMTYSVSCGPGEYICGVQFDMIAPVQLYAWYQTVLNGIVLSSAFPRLPVGITQIMVRNMLDGVVRVVPVPGYTPVGAFPTDVYAPAGYSVVQAYSNPAPAPALAVRPLPQPNGPVSQVQPTWSWGLVFADVLRGGVQSRWVGPAPQAPGLAPPAPLAPPACGVSLSFTGTNYASNGWAQQIPFIQCMWALSVGTGPSLPLLEWALQAYDALQACTPPAGAPAGPPTPACAATLGRIAQAAAQAPWGTAPPACTQAPACAALLARQCTVLQREGRQASAATDAFMARYCADGTRAGDPACGCYYSPVQAAACIDARCTSPAAYTPPLQQNLACSGAPVSCADWALLSSGRYLASQALPPADPCGAPAASLQPSNRLVFLLLLLVVCVMGAVLYRRAARRRRWEARAAPAAFAAPAAPAALV